MSALILDGFDHYGTGAAGIANMLDGVWASIPAPFTVGAPSWGPARTGPSCLIMTPSSLSNNARIVVPGTPAIMYFSHGFAIDFLPPYSGVNVFELRDAMNTTLYALVLNPTGSVSLYQGGFGGTLIATTAGPVIRTQTWHFIEAKVDYTSGSFVLRIDDPQANLTPALTASISTSGHNGFLAFSWGTNIGGDNVGKYYFDDLFIRDNAGSVNNAFLGDRRIALLNAAADTATAGWTPSFYQKFGTGVLRLANLTTNNNTPINPNATVYTAASTSLDVGNSDFTIESFVRFEQLPGASNYASIFSRWDAQNNGRSYRLLLGGQSFNNGNLQFDFSTDGTNSGSTTAISYPFVPDLNRWYHIAIVRASNELLLFVDGAQLGIPIPVTATFFGAGPEPFSIGAEVSTSGVVANTYVTGLYDETRFTNGFARYTAPFTPPAMAFPRGSSPDPHWADVVLISSYDAVIQDESSFARVLTPINGASQFTINDGPMIGSFSTINKIVPDDNTFISAALTDATGILTMTTQPATTSTVTVGTTDGTTAAVYTFRSSLTTAYDVLIDVDAETTLMNLINAINAGPGIGTKYGTGTLANFNVFASELPVGQMMVTANLAGSAGNSIASTSTSMAATWGAATLTGGANIPGPSDFKVQRPPPNTTIISAMQTTIRGYKSDAGSCSLQNAFIGPLGGVAAGSTHSLATNAGYYLDIIEADPDTSASITPATIINGKLRINRTV